MKNTVNRIQLIAVPLVSWSVLLWQLGERSLWVDEFLTIQMIQGTFSDAINTTGSKVAGKTGAKMVCPLRLQRLVANLANYVIGEH